MSTAGANESPPFLPHRPRPAPPHLPSPTTTTSRAQDALALRETQTTSILTQVRNDVTRFRYGDEQHLEEGLAVIFRYNRPGGLRKNQAPTLTGIAEQVIVGRAGSTTPPLRRSSAALPTTSFLESNGIL